MSEPKRCCGSCRRWEQPNIKNRPKSLDISRNGKCTIDKKERQCTDMEDCMGWKIADPWDIDKRLEQGIIEA